MDSHFLAGDVALAAALSQSHDRPHAAFAALHAAAERLVGARLFTVLAFDFPHNRARRPYSSDEEIYPTGAGDPIGTTIWEHTLIEKRQPLVLNSPSAMATLLPNVEQLVRLGCEAMLNLPVVMAGQTLGALNMLHENGRYTRRAHRGGCMALAPAAAAILLWMQRHPRTEPCRPRRSALRPTSEALSRTSWCSRPIRQRASL